MVIEHISESRRAEALAEPAMVWVTASGAPERLVWRGRRFLVQSRPVQWIDRIDWWTREQRASREAQVPVEQTMWQAQISAVDDQEILLVDLAAGDGGRWQVTNVYQ